MSTDLRTANGLESLMRETIDKHKHAAPNRHVGMFRPWTIKLVKDLSCCGDCNLHSHVIRMNEWLVREGPIDQVYDTLMHEVAHALVGIEITKTGKRMAHGKTWKVWARFLGATPKSMASDAELGEGASDNFGKKKPPKQYRYYIIFERQDGTYERVSKCCKRLRALGDREMLKRPETLGRLWMVRIDDYSESCSEQVAAKKFR